MKKFLFLAGLFMAAATASAQADLGKGNLQLNAGLVSQDGEFLCM